VDERVPIHTASDFYDVEGFLAGASSLRPFEVAEVGDVSGRTLVHTQCHFGLDALSWARRGATVTGLDFSQPAIDAARALAARAGLQAEFVQADVYDATSALGGRRFDVVYTGLGAINWLPDIEAWARTMASLVAPGGIFYLSEFHPFLQRLRRRGPVGRPCVLPRGPVRLGRAGHVRRSRGADRPQPLDRMGPRPRRGRQRGHRRRPADRVPPRARPHAVSAVAVPAARGRGIYRLPEGTPSLPLMFSLRAAPR
jgi:SAM-dependent methyltransferase